jgi:hypothetical protein
MKNGLLLLEFRVRNKLFLSSTGFEKRHYGTWTHAPTKKEFTIDHCLISVDSRNLVVNGGVIRSAECWTDHFLVNMVLKYDASVQKKILNRPIPKIDFSSLIGSTELRVDVGVELDIRLQQLLDAEQGITVQMYVDVVQSVCKKLIPLVPWKGKSKGDWFDSNDAVLCDLMRKRRVARLLCLGSKLCVDKEAHK